MRLEAPHPNGTVTPTRIGGAFLSVWWSIDGGISIGGGPKTARRLLLLLVEVDGRRPVISTGPRSGREKLTRTCLQCVVLVVLDDQM